MTSLADPTIIAKQVNSCYLSWSGAWMSELTKYERRHGFKQHLEQEHGVKIDFESYQIDYVTRYRLCQADVLDQSKFTMFLLMWS